MLRYRLHTLLIVLALGPPVGAAISQAVARLLKSRQAQSLCSSTTPRILIQEEDEEKLGIDIEQ
jgi:hypothetical protein